MDDGLATGSTRRAAIAALRQEQPKRLVVGVPIASPETHDALRDEVDGHCHVRVAELTGERAVG